MCIWNGPLAVSRKKIMIMRSGTVPSIADGVLHDTCCTCMSALQCVTSRL